ncbi:50S ribosomal protein L6 [Candidatus Dependentiae bacterium]|jgi:large subunit ribosomal protein L6|nr:50S ribosomal protein L6 [Candidatus Dependentiae bacterium]MCC7415092.1 50S ribosomal protein L6 [Campylobacterota bacterium]
MSKIGRRPISLAGVSVTIKGNEVHYKGPRAAGVYVVPSDLQVTVENDALSLTPSTKSRELNRIWGMHRALISNEIKGAAEDFVKVVQINGLGFKAALSGSKIVFSLGYSHKIEFDLPKEVALEIDKPGQKLTFKSADKELLGHVCSQIRALRPPEPYKGTGIKLLTEVLVRKAGKTKSS